MHTEERTTATSRWREAAAGWAPWRISWEQAGSYAVLVAFVLIVVGFSIARPDAFPTTRNAESIITLSVPLLILAIGLTIPMIMGDFDLSFAAVAQLTGAVALFAMGMHGAPIVVGILLALLVGMLVGVINGILVAFTRISAFILTLAMGSIAGGAELAITDGRSLGVGIPPSYLEIHRGDFLGISIPILSIIVVAVVGWWITRYTVFGRAVYAIGGNREAAHLAGINVRRMRVTAFVIMGVAAAVAGIFLTSRAASYYPNMAVGLLLPAFAAVFIGATIGKAKQFSVLGTVFGVIFMSTITTGLIMTNQPDWMSSAVSGVLLLGAILASHFFSKKSSAA